MQWYISFFEFIKIMSWNQDIRRYPSAIVELRFKKNVVLVFKIRRRLLTSPPSSEKDQGQQPMNF